MRIFSEKVILIILLVVACQLLNTFCSRKVYRKPSDNNTDIRADNNKIKDLKVAGTKKDLNLSTHTESKKLKAFIESGTGKKLNTSGTNPDEIVTTAQKYLGVPHCMGGTTMKCIDCSGLLVTVFARHRINLPHNSQEQARFGRIIHDCDNLKKGDLVFFTRSYKTPNFITHSGIYIGENKFIHASTSDGVTITSLSDPYWKEKFVYGTRVFE